MNRRYALTLLGLAILAGCGSSSASPSRGLGDAARVWCLDYHNQVKLGHAAVTLGIDNGPAGTSPAGDSTLGETIRYWANGGDAANPLLQPGLISESTYQQTYGQQIGVWEAASPETFARACLAAFDAR